MNKSNKNKNKNKKLECCICYEKFKSYVIKTQCKHVMCLNCLVQLRKKECPMCRSNLEEELPEKIVNIINNNSTSDQRTNFENINGNNIFNSDRFYNVFNDLSSEMMNSGLNGFYSTNISFNNDTIYNDSQFFSSNRNNTNNTRTNNQNLTNNILAPFFEYFM
tara:strand:+ start:412 stop:900 length:489 start_codon:yes stop_codon:yes gene_type:complete